MRSKYVKSLMSYVCNMNEPVTLTNSHLHQFLQSKNKLIAFNKINCFSAIA